MSDQKRFDKLTDRQMQTARLVRLGYTNKEIADSIGLTTGTIKIRLYVIYRKIGVKNRADLAAWYVRNNR